MIEIKTQIVFSYETILNFSDLGRRLMNQYSRFADQKKIENTGAPAERVILVFGDERYYMDCNWERISFVAQGSRSSYRKRNGKTRFFFELLDEVSRLDDFTQFKNMKIASYDVVETLDRESFELSDFMSFYFSEETMEMEDELRDALILLETKRGEYDVNHHFGPFLSESDISKHDLLPFKSPKMDLLDELEDATGLLSKVEIVYQGVDMNLERFIDADKIRFSLAQNLAEQWSD